MSLVGCLPLSDYTGRLRRCPTAHLYLASIDPGLQVLCGHLFALSRSAQTAKHLQIRHFCIFDFPAESSSGRLPRPPIPQAIGQTKTRVNRSLGRLIRKLFGDGAAPTASEQNNLKGEGRAGFGLSALHHVAHLTWRAARGYLCTLLSLDTCAACVPYLVAVSRTLVVGSPWRFGLLPLDRSASARVGAV